MYILLASSEINYTKDSETKPPNRAYQIQVAVEQMFENERARGKKNFTIPKGTSIIKAVNSLQSKKEDMKSILKEKGTLRVEKIVLKNINNDDRKFNTCFDKFIQNRKIATRKYGKPASENTIRNYIAFYKKHLSIFDNKEIDDITANDIENLRNRMIEAKLKPATIKPLKVIMRQILEEYDVVINWRKIVFPTPDNVRKYDRDIEETIKIVNMIYNYLPEGSTRKYEINSIWKGNLNSYSEFNNSKLK